MNNNRGLKEIIGNLNANISLLQQEQPLELQSKEENKMNNNRGLREIIKNLNANIPLLQQEQPLELQSKEENEISRNGGTTICSTTSRQPSRIAIRGRSPASPEICRLNNFIVDEYEKIVSGLVDDINAASQEYCRSHHIDSNKVKLKMLFDYLASEENHFDYSGAQPNGTVNQIPYDIPQHENMNVGIAPYSKYAPILSHMGVCISYSRAFQDVCDRLNIPCMIVQGNTGMKHAWNAVRINGEVKYIDVAFAIMNRRMKDNYFLKNGNEVSRLWGNRIIYQESIADIKRFSSGERIEETNGLKNDVIAIRVGHNEEELKHKKH